MQGLRGVQCWLLWLRYKKEVPGGDKPVRDFSLSNKICIGLFQVSA